MGIRATWVARALSESHAVVIGASGLVGGSLLRQLGTDAIGTYHQRARQGLMRLDARDRHEVAALLDRIKPEVIFFPAANPNVDWCEREPEEAAASNLEPLRIVIAAAPRTPIVAYSTDYVFDGHNGPYRENDHVSPLSVYGRLKVELEALVVAAGGLVIRTTGVFGWEPSPPRNFVLRLLGSLRQGTSIRLPSDQIANPTYVEDLAAVSIELAREGAQGIWHVAGPDQLSRDAFGRVVADAFGLSAALIEGLPTADLEQLAARPLRGGLVCERYRLRFGRDPVRPVRGALAELRAQLDLVA